MANTFVEFLDNRIVPYIEKGMLGTFLILALFMYFYANGFPDAPSQFPQLAAAAVILTGSLVFFWNYLPAKIQFLEADNPIESLEGELFDVDDEELSEEETASLDRVYTELPYDKYGVLPLHYHVAIVTLLYGVLGYFFGLFWPTPVIVYAYARLSGLSWIWTVILVLISIGAAWGFYDVLNAPILEGALHEWEYL